MELEVGVEMLREENKALEQKVTESKKAVECFKKCQDDERMSKDSHKRVNAHAGIDRLKHRT